MTPITEERRRHGEVVEQLRRLNTGIETVVGQLDSLANQQRELIARCDAVLRYAVQLWQEQQRGSRRPRP